MILFLHSSYIPPTFSSDHYFCRSQPCLADGEISHHGCTCLWICKADMLYCTAANYFGFISVCYGLLWSKKDWSSISSPHCVSEYIKNYFWGWSQAALPVPTSNFALNLYLNSRGHKVNKSAVVFWVNEVGSCTSCHLDRWMTQLLVILLKIALFIILLPLLYPPNLCSHLSSFLHLALGLTCILYLALMNSSLYVSHFFSLPSFLYYFHFLCFLFFSSFFSVLLSSHPLGCWRMWLSVMSQATGGLLEVNKREAVVLPGVLHMHARPRMHTHTDTRIYKHTFGYTHTPVKLLNLPQRTRLPEGKMPQKEKQRGGIISLCPPLSISFETSLPPAAVFSGALQCSTIMQSDQRVLGFRSEGQVERVWNTRWETKAGEQSCQSNTISNSLGLVFSVAPRTHGGP